jgi:predicted dehydrogenase
MKPVWSRRRLLGALGAMAAGVPLPSFGVVGANERIRLGLIGCGLRGADLTGQFAGLGGVEWVAVSDPDTRRMASVREKLAKNHGHAVKEFRDYRKLLEQAEVDAVVIATPHYWHALQTIHACQAGKDVFVEKPVTFHLGESEILQAVAAKSGRIVQAGTQNRSDVGLIEAFAAIRGGEYGPIRSIRGLCYRERDGIGKIDQALKPPADLDYDLWLGPAQDRPIFRPNLHYDWHWDWNTGNGDIGNQGPHEMDLISWVLGDPALPERVRSLGGRFAWRDAGNTANLQVAWFEMGGVPVIFEVNNLRVRPDLKAAPSFKSIRVGIVVTCEGGEFRGGRGGGFIVGPEGGKAIRKFSGDGGGDHPRNFLEAVRSRRAADLRGDLAVACRSSALSHLANISLRAGQAATREEIRKAVPETEEMHALLDAQEKQLEVWSVNPREEPYTLGPEIRVDARAGMVLGELADSEIVRPPARKGYELPVRA